tara:strand:- start:698 stop:1498 length:801 start_codon:yes stop_codon:yes gene_type:complete
MYEPYKKNRKVVLDKKSVNEREEDVIWWEAFDDFCTYVKENTNCSVLRESTSEADDLIALWTQAHPDDKHIIISSDSDFYQLINPNVSLYNGVANQIVTVNGFYDEKDKPIVDKKTGLTKMPPNPEWMLFEKCMRGDSADNVFSAYPKVRKTKLEEAFKDKNNQGFMWNNLMLQRWTDHNGVEHRVKECYERNKKLIDLTQQPDEIKTKIYKEIYEAQNPKHVEQVGVRFMKFCAKYGLTKLSEQPTDHAQYLNAGYPRATSQANN